MYMLLTVPRRKAAAVVPVIPQPQGLMQELPPPSLGCVFREIRTAHKGEGKMQEGEEK